MRAALALVAPLLSIGACGGGGGDWTSRAVKPVSATFNGKAFTIDLPEGMRQKSEKYGVVWDFHEGDYTKTPEFTVSDSAGWKTADEYAKSESNVTTYLRKDTLPDGFIVAHENTSYPGKEDYLVYVVKDGWSCGARVTPWKRGDTVKDKLPAVEQMCLSLKPAK